MKPKRHLALLACAIILALPTAGYSITPSTDLNVTPTANGFAVENDGEHGARGMWCAAGVYAQSTGAEAPLQRIYVAEGRAPGLGQRSPVRFTLDPTGLSPRPAFLLGASFQQAGTSMSVQHALSLCHTLQSSTR